MGLLLVAAIVIGALALIRAKVEDRRARRAALAALALGLVGIAVVIGISVVDTLHRRGLPPPKFSSLVTKPDPSLRGTVAYLSEAKSPTAGRQACTRITSASGAESKDVLCWPIDEPPIATAVWRPDGRLLVSSFDAPVGKNRLVPKWAKLVDVATGATEDVPQSDLGRNARPSVGPAKNAKGERLIREGKDGNVHIALVGPSGSRTVFKVEDANPDWGIQTGPTWSPDFAWFLMWDGTRLLLTTVDEPATTRVLADEASGVAFNYDVPTFSITSRDVAAK